jgi:hypothetical protein
VLTDRIQVVRSYPESIPPVVGRRRSQPPLLRILRNSTPSTRGASRPKRNVEEMGGTIDIASVEGRGTSVRVTLPAAG